MASGAGALFDPIDGTQAASALLWNGSVLSGAAPSVDTLPPLAVCFTIGNCPAFATPCTPTNCETHAFRVEVPPGFAGTLVVAVRWPTDHSVDPALAITDAAGRTLAVGKLTYVDHLGIAAFLPNPASGIYHATVAFAHGRSSYQEGVHLDAGIPVDPPRPLLPDLVTLPPTDLRIAVPTAEEVNYFSILPSAAVDPATSAAGSRGCAVDEFATGARRCLRFGNIVGNVGEGPLDIQLTLADGATSEAGGHFIQYIHESNGSVTAHSAGPAQFHPIHAHWHNGDTNLFTLYAYDNATHARGPAIREGRKTGICFADVGVLDPRAVRAPPVYNGLGCDEPSNANRSWWMGLSPGWFDLYDWVTSDQYLEISGVPDGTYLLCSVTNAEHALLESNLSNDEACTPFALVGNTVHLLEPQPYQHIPENSSSASPFGR
jgi:hypothetical protein